MNEIYNKYPWEAYTPEEICYIHSVLETVRGGDVSSEVKEVLHEIDLLGNQKTLFDLMMQVKEDIFSILIQQAPTFKSLVLFFCNYASQQKWKWYFADEVANKCIVFYLLTKDDVIKDELFKAIMLIGVHHNRFDIYLTVGLRLHDINNCKVISYTLRPLKNDLRHSRLQSFKLNSALKETA